MGPLYVTVPSTDHTLRCTLLGVADARPLMSTLAALIGSGITLHAQVVVCPGLNDGAALRSTLTDLHTLGPALRSVALVPVGTTRYTANPQIRRSTHDELRDLLAAARHWNLMRATPWVFASDEVYLALGIRVPGTRHYGDSPQLSTGVGMVRRFLDDFARVRRRRPPRWGRNHRILVATGILFTPTLSRCVAELNERWGTKMEVVGIENRFFGPSVSVAGLLGGAEIIESLGSVSADVVILSSDAVAYDNARFIDDVELETFQNEVGTPLVTGELLSDIVRATGDLLG